MKKMSIKCLHSYKCFEKGEFYDVEFGNNPGVNGQQFFAFTKNGGKVDLGIYIFKVLFGDLKKEDIRELIIDEVINDL
jgi:hypothetical protein